MKSNVHRCVSSLQVQVVGFGVFGGGGGVLCQISVCSALFPLAAFLFPEVRYKPQVSHHHSLILLFSWLLVSFYLCSVTLKF